LVETRPSTTVLSSGNVAERAERAGTLIVVLEQQGVVVGGPLEELLGDGLVGAGADPVVVVVAPAQVKAERDAGHPRQLVQHVRARIAEIAAELDQPAVTAGPAA